MWRRWLPLVLALGAASLDAAGWHALAFHILLATVPAAAVSALGALAELIDLRADGRAQTATYVQQFLAALGLVLVVLSAAARAPELGGTSTPAFAINVLTLGLALLCLEAIVSALYVPRPARISRGRSLATPLPGRPDPHPHVRLN